MNDKILPVWNSMREILNFKYNFDLATVPDHGGFGVDVNYSLSEDDAQVVSLESTEIKSNCVVSDYRANFHCLPFLPPAKRKNLDDPCLGETKRKIDQHEVFFSSFNSLKFSGHSENWKPHKKLHSALQNLSDKNGPNNAVEMEVPEMFYNTANLYPEDFPAKSNWNFSGNCLDFIKNQDQASLILHPSGASLNKITATELIENKIVKEFDEGFTYGQQFSKKLKGGIIYGITSSEKDSNYSRDNFVVRQNKTCHIMSLENQNSFRIIETIESDFTFSSACLSPHLPEEVLLCTNNGIVTLHSSFSHDPVWETKTPMDHLNPEDPNNNWWIADFGSHPRSLMILDRDTFFIQDLRWKANMYNRKELFSTKCSNLTEFDELLLFVRNPLQHFQYIIATTHSILLVDERYPDQVLNSWNHMLDSSPTSISTTLLDKVSPPELLIFLSCQNSNETSCLQLDSQSCSNNLQATSLSPPWHIAAPQDFIKILKLQGVPINKSVQSRTSMPLVGSGAIPRSCLDGFTIFQLNSIGDIYYQNYIKNSKGEKTYAYGSACNFIPENKILTLVSDWIKEAEIPEKTNIMELNYKVATHYRVKVMNKTLIEHKPFCPICNQDYTCEIQDTVEICSLCKTKPSVAQCVIKTKELNAVFPSNYYLEETSTNNLSYKKSLDLIDLNKTNDPLGLKLLSHWKSDSNETITTKPVGNVSSDEEDNILQSILFPASLTPGQDNLPNRNHSLVNEASKSLLLETQETFFSNLNNARSSKKIQEVTLDDDDDDVVPIFSKKKSKIPLKRKDAFNTGF